MMITRAVSSNPVSSIGTSFDLAKAVQVDLGMFPDQAPYRGYVSLILAQVSNISSATTLTIRICRDAAGDECIITDTTTQLFNGLTTSTKGTGAWALNAFASLEEDDIVFVFFKTNNGTLDIDFVEVTWGTI